MLLNLDALMDLNGILHFPPDFKVLMQLPYCGPQEIPRYQYSLKNHYISTMFMLQILRFAVSLPKE